MSKSKYYPVVLVLSECESLSPKEIIKNILKSNHDQEPINVNDNLEFKGYVHEIITKYYKLEIILLPFNEPLVNLSSDILNSVEGILVYFNSKKNVFLKSIKNYESFMEQNNIELGVLLCENLMESENTGITFKNINDQTTSLDIVELCRTKDDSEENNITSGILSDPVGYDELHDIMRNYVWSNIEMNPKPLSSRSNEDEVGNTSRTIDKDDANIENELEFVEKLLNDIIVFKNASSHLSRNEKLAHAEKIAEKFDKILQDLDDEDDD